MRDKRRHTKFRIYFRTHPYKTWYLLCVESNRLLTVHFKILKKRNYEIHICAKQLRQVEERGAGRLRAAAEAVARALHMCVRVDVVVDSVVSVIGCRRGRSCSSLWTSSLFL